MSVHVQLRKTTRFQAKPNIFAQNLLVLSKYTRSVHKLPNYRKTTIILRKGLIPSRGGGCWSTFRSSKILGNIGCCGDVKAARYLDLRRWRTAVCGMISRHVPGPRRVPSCLRYEARVRSRPVDIPSSLSFCRMCCAMYLGRRGNCLYRVGETHEYARAYLF